MPVLRSPMLSRTLLGLTIFAVLLLALTTRVPKWLTDFDQSFYLTIAYDLDRHKTFSNGIFTRGDDPLAAPRPGMFFAPLYPTLVYGAMQVSPRFKAAAFCATEALLKKTESPDCEVYALPIHIMHAMFLALAALAIGFAAQTVLESRRAFSIAAAFATAGYIAEADLFSFAMTESVTVSLFSATVAAWIAGLKTGSRGWLIVAGAALALLCLTRASYLALIPFFLAPIILARRYRFGLSDWRSAIAFFAVFAVLFTPWVARNAVSIGKAAVSEEYSAAAMIERFAFNDMTAKEFVLAFPYCVPVVGPATVKTLAPGAMDRFQWDRPGSFFDIGRSRRDKLVAEHKRLDPVIGEIVSAELRERGLNHVLSAIPLGWCGLWVSGWWSLLMLPLFAFASVRAARARNAMFFLYALPAFVMVGLHAVLANHYARYNLGLVGPYSAGAALLIVHALRLRERANAQAA